MPHLELDETIEDRIASTFTYLVIVAALATVPLTAAYWFEWEHWGFVVADWAVWSVFVAEYGFYLAITTDRWRTTQEDVAFGARCSVLLAAAARSPEVDPAHPAGSAGSSASPEYAAAAG